MSDQEQSTARPSRRRPRTTNSTNEQRPRKRARVEPSSRQTVGPSRPPIQKRRGRPPNKPTAEHMAQLEAIRAQASQAGVKDLVLQAWDDDLVKGRRFLTQEAVKPEEMERFTQNVNLSALPEVVRREWAQCKQKDAFKKLEDKPKTLVCLWKVCMQLYRCSPLAFISPAEDMRYDGNATEPQGADSILWSGPFCTKLSWIVSHVAFRRSQPTVAYFLRFAVVCRLRTRRALKPMLNTTCSLLSELEELTSEDAWDHDIHMLHVQLRRKAEHANMLPSIESDILYHLGCIVAADRSKDDKVYDDYPVRIGDLNNIIKALDSYDGNSHHAYFARSELMYKAYVGSRGAAGLPEEKQVGVAHRNAWLEELCIKHSGVFPEPGPEPESEDDVLGSDDDADDADDTDDSGTTRRPDAPQSSSPGGMDMYSVGEEDMPPTGRTRMEIRIPSRGTRGSAPLRLDFQSRAEDVMPSIEQLADELDRRPAQSRTTVAVVGGRPPRRAQARSEILDSEEPTEPRRLSPMDLTQERPTETSDDVGGRVPSRELGVDDDADLDGESQSEQHRASSDTRQDSRAPPTAAPRDENSENLSSEFGVPLVNTPTHQMAPHQMAPHQMAPVRGPCPRQRHKPIRVPY